MVKTELARTVHAARSSRIQSIWKGIVVMSCFLLCSSCGTPDAEQPAQVSLEDDIPFRLDGHLQIIQEGNILTELEIEIAETDSARTRGMMQRTHLPDTRGMLFLFDSEEDRFFWMANTPLSLDLIFISADSTIIHMAKYMRPLSPQDVPSNGPAQYVLEVIAGYSDTIGVVEGDRVSWRRIQSE